MSTISVPAAATNVAGAADKANSASAVSSAAQYSNILDPIMSGVSSAMNMIQARRSQRRAFKYGKEMYKHRFQWTVEDLKAAGLNPMLAYMTGPGSATAGPAPVSSANDVGRTRAGARQATTAEKLAAAQVNNIETQASLNSAHEAEARSRTGTEITKQLLNRTLDRKAKVEAQATTYENSARKTRSTFFDMINDAWEVMKKKAVDQWKKPWDGKLELEKRREK